MTSPDSDLLDKIIAKIQEIVYQSQAEVLLGAVAAKLGQALGKQAKARWDSEGGFRKFIQKIRIPGVELTLGADGQEYLCDPTRHKVPSSKQTIQKASQTLVAPAVSTQAQETSQEPSNPIAQLPALIQKVHQVTKVPLLTSEQYGVVFQAIADALRAHGYTAETTITEVHICRAQRLDLTADERRLIDHWLGGAIHTM